MRFELDQAPIGLAPGAVLKVRDAGGRSLRVTHGRVWVTEEGSLDDVFLAFTNTAASLAPAGEVAR